VTYDNPSALQGLRPASRYVQLGAAKIDLATHEVRLDGDLTRLTPKSAEVLKVLLRHEGEPVARELLIDQVWRDQYPSDDVVTKAVGELRRTLCAADEQVIETIPRVGYRLIAVVQWLEGEGALPAIEAPEAENNADQTADVLPTFSQPSAENAVPEPKNAVAAVSQRWPWVALAMIPLLLIIAIMGWRQQPAVVPEPTASAIPNLPISLAGRLNVALKPIAAESGAEYMPAISPDGKIVVYSQWVEAISGRSRLMIRTVGAESARPLTGVSDRTELASAWSPDGRSVVYQSATADSCHLMMVDSVSGERRQVGECYSHFVEWMDFTPDGRGILLSRSVGESAPQLRILDLQTGQFSGIDYQRSDWDNDVQGIYSPDGTLLAFRRGASPHSDIYLTSAKGGEVQRMTTLRTSIRGMDWLPDSRHIVFSSDHDGSLSLWLLDTSSGDLQPIGAYGATFPSVARSGDSLVFQQQLQPHNLIRIDFSDDGIDQVVPIFQSARADGYPAISVDRKSLAFVSNRSGRNEIMLGDIASGSVTRLTRTQSGEVSDPQWAPDGQSLLFTHRRVGGAVLVELDLATRRMSDIDLPVTDARHGRFSADGQWIFFDAEVDDTRQAFRAPRDGGGAERLSEVMGTHPQPDPSGRYVFFLDHYYRLQRMDLEDRSITALELSIGYANRDAWVVRADGVYALKRVAGKGEQTWGVHRWDLLVEPGGSAEIRTINTDKSSPIDLALLGVSIESQSTIYTTAELNGDIDVMLLEGL